MRKTVCNIILRVLLNFILLPGAVETFGYPVQNDGVNTRRGYEFNT